MCIIRLIMSHALDSVDATYILPDFYLEKYVPNSENFFQLLRNNSHRNAEVYCRKRIKAIYATVSANGNLIIFII